MIILIYISIRDLIVSHTLYFKFHDKKRIFDKAKNWFKITKKVLVKVVMVSNVLMKVVNDWFFAV